MLFDFDINFDFNFDFERPTQRSCVAYVGLIALCAFCPSEAA